MKVPTIPPPWEGCADVMATWEEGGVRRFALSGRSDVITAELLAGDLLLYPERSSAHRALISALGLNEA